MILTAIIYITTHSQHVSRFIPSHINIFIQTGSVRNSVSGIIKIKMSGPRIEKISIIISVLKSIGGRGGGREGLYRSTSLVKTTKNIVLYYFIASFRNSLDSILPNNTKINKIY